MKLKDIFTKENEKRWKFVEEYKKASNASTGSQFDSNANVATKNISTEQCELGKGDLISFHYFTMYKNIENLYGTDVANSFVDDEDNHRIYVHDSSSLFPYCCSISLYPYLLNGLQGLGGSSDVPKHANSYIGGIINLIFLVASQFAGACLYKDQRLLVRINGIPYSMTSKELFELGEKNSESKIKTFSTLTDKWEYYLINDVEVFEDGKWVRVNKVFRREYDDDIYNVTTKSGHSVYVSKDHKFKHLYRTRDFETRASDLVIGDTLYSNVEYNSVITKESDDYRIGQIIGLIAGDGSVRDTCTRVSINTEQLFIADFLDKYLPLLGINNTKHTRQTEKRTDKVINYYVGSTSVSKIIKLATRIFRWVTYSRWLL